MSLTRKEWEEMWETIKRIEHSNSTMQPRTQALLNQMDINRIKNQIQQVIGQME